MDRAFPITTALTASVPSGSPAGDADSRASRFSLEGSPPLGITLLRYPHGKFRGGMTFTPLFPAFTSSSWRENNFLLLEYDI